MKSVRGKENDEYGALNAKAELVKADVFSVKGQGFQFLGGPMYGTESSQCE